MRLCLRKGVDKGKEKKDILRIASWNVGTLRGKLLEVVDVLKRHRIDVTCLQEIRWKENEHKECNEYKLLYAGSNGTKNGVGFLVKLELYTNVIDVIRYNDRVMVLKLVLNKEVVTVACAYAPQVRLGEHEKKEF